MIAEPGRQTFAPVEVPPGFEVRGATFRVDPLGMPIVMALAGRLVPAGSNAVVVVSENIAHHRYVPLPLSQRALELEHVRRFLFDFRHLGGAAAGARVVEGADPPDFLLIQGDARTSLECTRFTLRERQTASGLFADFRRRLVLENPERFQRAKGHLIYFAFHAAHDGKHLPNARADEIGIQSLMMALENFDAVGASLFDRTTLAGPGDDLSPAFHSTDSGVVVWGVRFGASTPNTDLTAVAGFEIALAYSSIHRMDEEWDALVKAIARKDVEQNEWLLISAGAPDNSAATHPAEELVLDELLKRPVFPVKLRHLRRVLVHFWSTGEIVQLFPLVHRYGTPSRP